jgi:hypothetical protein
MHGFWGQKSHDNYIAAAFCSDHRQTRGRWATKPGTEPEDTPRYNISACTAAATPNLRHTTEPDPVALCNRLGHPERG